MNHAIDSWINYQQTFNIHCIYFVRSFICSIITNWDWGQIFQVLHRELYKSNDFHFHHTNSHPYSRYDTLHGFQHKDIYMLHDLTSTVIFYLNLKREPLTVAQSESR